MELFVSCWSLSSLRKAEIRPCGFLVNFTAVASAKYSRLRETASWIILETIGERMSKTIPTISNTACTIPSPDDFELLDDLRFREFLPPKKTNIYLKYQIKLEQNQLEHLSHSIKVYRNFLRVQVRVLQLLLIHNNQVYQEVLLLHIPQSVQDFVQLQMHSVVLNRLHTILVYF